MKNNKKLNIGKIKKKLTIIFFLICLNIIMIPFDTEYIYNQKLKDTKSYQTNNYINTVKNNYIIIQ